MKRACPVLGCFLLLLCCGTLAVLNADEPMRRWQTRFGGVLIGTWDRSLDEPDGSLIRIRSQSNLYRVRVDDLSPEDRWYVMNQRIADSEQSEMTSSTEDFKENAPQPLPSAADQGKNLSAPIPDEDSDWGVSMSQSPDSGTLSTDDSIDAEFVPLPETPKTEPDKALSEETPTADPNEASPPPPNVPGTGAGERRVYKIGGVFYPFRWCPPGTFAMGSPRSEPGRSDNEPLHKVTLTKGFWILETEVTQRMWTNLFDTNPSWFSNTGTGAPRVKHVETGDLPVEQATWEEAVLFCQRLFVRRENQSGRR